MGGSSKKVTVGYKYYVGMHMALCHGPVDKLVRIRVGGKDAWVGNNTGGALTIDKKDLFGGEKREGGVTGQVDVEMGKPDQGQNSYLASRLGSALLPAFRGVCCAVLRQVYVGLNPDLKDWGWLLQRIHTRQNGVEQWYDEKAEIDSGYFVDDSSIISGQDLPYTELFCTGGGGWGWLEIPYTDTSDYSSETPLGGSNLAPFTTGLPHGWFNFSPWTDNNDGYFTLMSVDKINWFGRAISVEDKRPINFVFAFDDWITVWVDGNIVFSKTTGDSGRVINFTYTPTRKNISLVVRVYDAAQPALQNLAYFDGYAYQSAVSSEDAHLYYFGGYSDMNPAHIIRECLTDTNWGMGYPEEDIDGTSFTAAADALYSEGMGISILWSQQTSIEDFVEEILRHIDAALYVDRATGKFKLKLIRDDYDESTLLVLDQSNISRVDGYTKQTMAELVNEITVTYNSNESGQTETVTLQNLAMVQQQGAIIPASVEYMGFANNAIAAKAAARDLKAMSTPLVTATIYANRGAAGLNIGDVFVWNWTETDEEGNGIATSYIMRVTEIAFGDGVDNIVRIQCAQDVFALPDITYVEAEPTEWTDPSAAPLPATPRLVAEAPYYEIVRQLGEVDAAAKLSSLPELGMLMVAAGRPAAEINAELQVDSGAGYTDGGTLDFCPCAALDGAIGYLDTAATLKDGVDLDEFVAGSLAQVDDEIVVIESITEGVATIRRGCLDTVPAEHADGAAVIIWDGYTASDEVEYVASDEVDVAILTITGQGPLAIADAPVDSVVMGQRALRPYPPADVKIGGSYYPSLVVADDLVGIVVTWVHRDRTQQTGGTVLGWTDASVGPESGVTYSARLLRTDTEVELDSSSAINGTTVTLTPSYRGEVRVELWAERGGISSLLKFSHEFKYYAMAMDDTATTDAATTTSGNVLTNDSGGTLTVSAVNGLAANVGQIVAGSNGGEFVINADGSWTFDPAGDFTSLTGSDTATTSVTYHASDGVAEAMATLTVTVSSAASVPTDPLWAYVSLCINPAGADGSTTITDAKGATLAIGAGIEIDTDALGVPAILNTGANGITVTNAAVIPRGTEDFCVEAWLRKTVATSGYEMLIESPMSGGLQIYFGSVQGQIRLGSYGVDYQITTPLSSMPISTLKHIAFTRRGTAFKIYIDGTQVSSTTSNVVYETPTTQTIMNNLKALCRGLRITRGHYRYESEFAPPTLPFPVA